MPVIASAQGARCKPGFGFIWMASSLSRALDAPRHDVVGEMRSGTIHGRPREPRSGAAIQTPLGRRARRT
jgi:hypothetical protein